MRRLSALSLSLALLFGSEASAARLQVSEDAFVDLRAFLQPQGQVREYGAPNGTSTGTDFFLRRARLMVFGNATKQLSFFVDTDAPNFGKGGSWNTDVYIQDALASYQFLPGLALDTGLILVPLTHHALQGAVALNTVDYHSFLIKYPKDSTKVWRDTGFQLRGLLFKERFQYRLGVFGGVRGQVGRVDTNQNHLPDLNPKGHPRLAGTVRFNLLDPEPDFFLAGTYLGKKRVVSLGLAADYQSRSSAAGASVSDYLALGGDVFVDYPIGEYQEVVFQLNAIQYQQGKASPSSGLGLFAEASYRWKSVSPVLGFDWFDSETGNGDFQAGHLGFNYWLNGHVANLKLDLALEKDVALQKASTLQGARWTTVATLQTQFFF